MIFYDDAIKTTIAHISSIVVFVLLYVQLFTSDELVFSLFFTLCFSLKVSTRSLTFLTTTPGETQELIIELRNRGAADMHVS